MYALERGDYARERERVKLRLRKDRRVPEVQRRWSNTPMVLVVAVSTYTYSYVCTGTRDPYKPNDQRPLLSNKQPSALSIAEAARDIISTDSYLLQKTVPESENRAAIYSQIRNI